MTKPRSSLGLGFSGMNAGSGRWGTDPSPLPHALASARAPASNVNLVSPPHLPAGASYSMAAHRHTRWRAAVGAASPPRTRPAGKRALPGSDLILVWRPQRRRILAAPSAPPVAHFYLSYLSSRRFGEAG